MSRLTSLQGTFRAHVLAARLDRRGLRRRAARCARRSVRADVGDMARVDVYVPGDQIEEASIVLLVDRGRRGRRPLRRRPPAAAARPARERPRGRGADPVRADRGHRSRRCCAGTSIALATSSLEQPACSSSPLMRRNARRGRARSSSATSSWSAPERLAVGCRALGAELERVAELHAVGVLRLERFGDLLGLAAEHRVAPLVHHDAVVEDVVHLGVVVAGAADLGDEQLDLVRLHLVREHLAERLRVRVGELLAPTRLRGSTSSP